MSGNPTRKGPPHGKSHTEIQNEQWRKSLEHKDITDYRTVAEVLAETEKGKK